MAVIEIELWQFTNSDTEYISIQDAARYLRMSADSVDYFASQGRMKMERVESRWLLQWETVQTFGRELRGKRHGDYEVKIIRPAQPQV